jgi:hypothetical protein
MRLQQEPPIVVAVVVVALLGITTQLSEAEGVQV